jgi:hypothetical protein
MRTYRQALVERMKAERWERFNLRKINPYTIDRVTGTVTLSRPWAWGSRKEEIIDVHAYDVRCPDGSTFRFARLKDAKTFITYHSNGLAIPAALAAGLAVG